MRLDFDNTLEVLENEPLSKHSSFKIGGEARYAIFPQNKDEMIGAIEAIKRGNIKFAIVGNGSNLLFDDDGFDGAIIFTKNIKKAVDNHSFY